MQDITRTLDVLTAMIEGNMRRNKLYQSLAEKTKQAELRALFTQYADQSRRFINNLSTWRSAYGGFSTMHSTTDSIGTWAQIRSLLDLGLRKNVLLQCEHLEHDILRIYKSAICMSCLPAPTSADVRQQYRELETALTKVHVLRERPASTREVFARA
jgi:uncharacterized protein (TIGR02284 family)